jgi:hypothetical protein
VSQVLHSRDEKSMREVFQLLQCDIDRCGSLDAETLAVLHVVAAHQVQLHLRNLTDKTDERLRSNVIAMAA